MILRFQDCKISAFSPTGAIQEAIATVNSVLPSLRNALGPAGTSHKGVREVAGLPMGHSRQLTLIETLNALIGEFNRGADEATENNEHAKLVRTTWIWQLFRAGRRVYGREYRQVQQSGGPLLMLRGGAVGSQLGQQDVLRADNPHRGQPAAEGPGGMHYGAPQVCPGRLVRRKILHQDRRPYAK